MCWWIFGHCWHKVEGSEVMLPVRDRKCKYANPYVGLDKFGGYLVLRETEECCFCGKRKYYIVKKYDTSQWNKYKIFAGNKDEDGDRYRGIYCG